MPWGSSKKLPIISFHFAGKILEVKRSEEGTDGIFRELFNDEIQERQLIDKRGAIALAGIIKCATNCDPLSFKGYGCYCGFLGSGQPVDGIDRLVSKSIARGRLFFIQQFCKHIFMNYYFRCCKMHDWCYTTTTCMGFEWQLPYFVPFKWKCNGGAPYCIPGKTQKSNRNSCSHQLCECDREFAMCLQKYLPCPSSKVMCKQSKRRLWQNVLMELYPFKLG